MMVAKYGSYMFIQEPTNSDINIVRKFYFSISSQLFYDEHYCSPHQQILNWTLPIYLSVEFVQNKYRGYQWCQLAHVDIQEKFILLKLRGTVKQCWCHINGIELGYFQ